MVRFDLVVLTRQLWQLTHVVLMMILMMEQNRTWIILILGLILLIIIVGSRWLPKIVVVWQRMFSIELIVIRILRLMWLCIVHNSTHHSIHVLWTNLSHVLSHMSRLLNVWLLDWLIVGQIIAGIVCHLLKSVQLVGVCRMKQLVGWSTYSANSLISLILG